MSPFSTDFTVDSSTEPATGPATVSATMSATGSTAPGARSASSASSTAVSLRRHAILSDFNLLQVAALMGTGLLVALGVALGGRSYITTVGPDDMTSAHGTGVENAAMSSTATDGGSSSAPL